jgi:predicted molibdopterin-dependent oxidoreductase YjgC
MGVRNPNERAPVRHTARYRETRFQSTLSEAEPVGGEFDLHFNNGCMLEHHEGNMTYRAPDTRESPARVPRSFP